MAPTHLGSYPVERELGRGGMGVVYLARDPRLDRPVAIKVVPTALALNPDNMARFEREAKLLAAVNHPNIASIYGVEDVDGQRLLVMEYVPGETLAERLGRGPLPIDEALDVARQIAAAIEAAHEGGIIHRDLKPGNVKVVPDGTVKVLDFGLAKGAAASSADLAQSPTLTYSPTAIGVILGTAGYMSPEQARGKPVDRRADIWAFGCVLFETLTCRKTFEGETVSDTIARIIEREPAWEHLPPATPLRIRDLLRRCLEKDLKKRQRDIGDVRIEIEDVIASRHSSVRLPAGAVHDRPAPGGVRRFLMPLLCLVLGAAATAAVLAWPRSAPAPTYLSIAMPRSIDADLALFLKQSDVVMVRGRLRRADGSLDPKRRLWTRRLDSAEFTPIEGTEGVSDWARSPDGRWLAASVPAGDGVERRLVKLAVDGSAPQQPLGQWRNDWGDMLWLSDGDLLVFAAQQTKYVRVPTNGGAPKDAVDLVFEGKYAAGPYWNIELPDGHVLMTVESWGSRGFQQDTWWLDTKTGKARLAIENAAGAVYLPDTGHLLYSTGANLMAVVFDPATGTLGSDPAAIFQGLRSSSWSNGRFSVSASGHLIHEPGGRLGLDRHIVTVTPGRDVRPVVSHARPFEAALRLSPDGKQVGVVIPTPGGTYDTWVAVLGQPGLTRTINLSEADGQIASWSPDMLWLAFNRWARGQNDGVYIMKADRSAPPVAVIKASSAEEVLWAVDWSRDIGVIINRVTGGQGDLVAVPVDATGTPGKVRPLRATAANEFDARVSPDGKLIAFQSDEAGSPVLYVSALSGGNLVGRPVPVTTDAAGNPVWSPNSARLYAKDSQDRVIAVAITSTPEIKASSPQVVFDLRALRLDEDCWDILPDGTLISVERGQGEDDFTSFSIVLNWLDHFRSSLPQKKK